jgi:DNA-directed RNA polymerase subunit RPC12/RpoP
MNPLEELKLDEKHTNHTCMTCGTEIKENYISYSYECERCVSLNEE